MKRTALLFFICAVLVCSASGIPGQSLSPRDLDPEYRKWIEEDVVYIISQKEREVFLQLQTKRERDIFINAFWKQRDPTPNTPENEFRNEHYRRIQYANNWFGKESPGPGWQSDQGRIYIILGEPKAIDRFDNFTEIHPTVVWFYENMAEYGLPTAFNVVFFKKWGEAEYVLYSPIKDGPQSLMINYNGDMTRYEQAYAELQKVQPEVAHVSLSLIPGESSGWITPSIASDILITSKIPAAPVYKVKDTYAEKLLKYKDVVEYDYSANFIDNDSLIRVFRDPSGIFFVHYLIEPVRLSFEEYEGKYSANLEVNGTAVDSGGNAVYQFERKIPINFNAAQLAGIRGKLFSFQDLFPLVPGEYLVSVILKNTVSKEFTSIENRVIVPDDGPPQMSPLTLANRTDRESKYRGQNKPFLLGGVQLLPSPRNDFLPDDTLAVYVQFRGLTEELKQGGSLEIYFLRADEKVRSLERGLREYPDPVNVIEEFPLAGIPPDYYTVHAVLRDRDGKDLLEEKAQFYITQRPFLARPWVVSLPLPGSTSPAYANTLGSQFLNKKDLTKATPLLEEAYGKNPANPKFALDLARALFEGKEYRRVKEIAPPFIAGDDGAAFLLLMGQSSQALGEHADAVSFYKSHLERFGTNLLVLNAIGECYIELGDPDEALIALEKSLEISPGQERIKKLVQSIKDKK